VWASVGRSAGQGDDDGFEESAQISGLFESGGDRLLRKPVDRRQLLYRQLRRRLAYLRRRSHVLDAAVMMGTLGGVATSCAALLLFVGTLRDRPGVSLFVAFGLALLFTMGALLAFLIEMLLASRGLRDQANCANEVGEMHELAAEGVGEPTHGESG
jgi:hypothetical protein